MHVACLAMMDINNQRRSRMLSGIAMPLERWYNRQNKDARSPAASEEFLVHQASEGSLVPLNEVFGVLRDPEFHDNMSFSVGMSTVGLLRLETSDPKATMHAQRCWQHRCCSLGEQLSAR
jgi:hypothetical protein